VECGALTPLWFFLLAADLLIRDREKKNESGVKPPQSKGESQSGVMPPHSKLPTTLQITTAP